MDHPLAVYTMCGSDLGADRGEQLLCAGSPDSTGHHSGLAVAEDGAAPVGETLPLIHSYYTTDTVGVFFFY